MTSGSDAREGRPATSMAAEQRHRFIGIVNPSESKAINHRDSEDTEKDSVIWFQNK
jgi:hypothetical protein